MEETKYFIPDIEDIRVGYEYELNLSNSYKGEDLVLVDSTWNRKVATTQDIITIYGCREMGWVRVPFLSKEQIEGEGWGDVEIYRDGGTLVYKKPVAEQSYYELTYRGANILRPSTNVIISLVWHLLDTGKRIERRLFDGECKDINTLRMISKLVEV